MPGKMIGIMDENIYFDISSVFSGSPYPYTDTQDFLRKLCDMAGADHMMWGTDSPAILCGEKEIYGQMLRYLQDGNLFSQKELALIYGETAAALYGL